MNQAGMKSVPAVGQGFLTGFTLIFFFLICFVFPKKLMSQTASLKKVEIYPIVISTQPGMEKQEAAVYQAAVDAIKRDPQYSVVAGIRNVYGVKDADLLIFQKAEKLYKEALKLYDDLDLPGAMKKAEGALNKIEIGAPYLMDMSLLVKVLHLIGVCHTLNGDIDKAVSVFLRAYLINPSMSPDTTLYPQDVVPVFESAGQAAFSAGTGSIFVSSEPSGARVYLDGMTMGVSPVNIDNVVAGKHILRLEKDGYRYFGTVFTIQANQKKQIDATMIKVTSVARSMDEVKNLPVLFARGMSKVLPSLRTIASDFGVEQLLIIMMTPGEGEVVSFTMLVYDRLKNSVIAQRQGDSLSRQPPGLTQKAAQLTGATLVAAIAKAQQKAVVKMIAPTVTIAPEKEEKKKKRKEKKSIASKWWFWTALVGAVGIAAGGGYLGYAAATGQIGSKAPGGSGSSGEIILEF